MTFSIRTLLICITLLAAVAAILATGSPLGSMVFFVTACMYTLTFSMRIVYCTGRRRAFWIGCSTYGIAYLVYAASSLEQRTWLTTKAASALLRSTNASMGDFMVQMRFLGTYETVFEGVFMLLFSAIGGLICAFAVYRPITNVSETERISHE